MLKRFLTNKVFVFLFLRYLAYALQFLGTLVIAYKLGPEDYGIWAYILIIFQFFNFLNFGIPNSVNNLLAIHRHRTGYIQHVLSSGFLLLLINIALSAAIFIVFQTLLGILQWNDIDLENQSWTFLAIISLSYLNNFFLNVFRVFNKYFAISLFQVIVPLSVLLIGLLYSGKVMIDWLVLAYLGANVISLIVFLIAFPVPISLQVVPRVLKRMFNKSMKLFAYNSSFYFITLSLRYILSEYYSQKQFGQFSFALTISLALMLVLDTFSFLILPKFINKLSRFSAADYNFFTKLRADYIVLSHFLIYAAVLGYGLMVNVFTEYTSTFHLFVILVMANAIYSLGFGFSVLLMAKEKESLLALISSSALLLNISIAIGVVALQLGFVYSGISILITYLFLVSCQMYFGERLISDKPYWRSLKTLFAPRNTLHIILTLLMTVFGLPPFYYVMSFGLFLALNFKGLKSVALRFKGLVNNPSQVDLK